MPQWGRVDEPKTERIRQGLVGVERAGDFAASFEISAMGLVLDVEGVGACRFPLTPERVAQLIQRSEPSHFGHREMTLHNENVRKSWEIPGSRVHLDPSLWSSRLERGIDRVVRALGFPTGGDVSASLQKLVLYDAGGFFVPHRDTERDPSMWGTLVIVLPSVYRGGEMVVRHAGECLAFDTSPHSAARRLCFVAFYGDCPHEIRPVEEGTRVALVYSLHARSDAQRPIPGHQLTELRTGLESFFASGEDWLVVLLDHAYTQQRFAWSELKNLDGVRIDALRRIGSDLNYACFLAFADVEEWFDLDDDEDRGGAVVTRADFGARRGGQLQLTAWVDEAGRPCAGTAEHAEDPCIVSTIPSLDRHPYEIAGEPWTGNEGGTAEQWYHQAAVVLVPLGTSLHDAVATPLEVEPRKSSKRQVMRRRKKTE